MKIKVGPETIKDLFAGNNTVEVPSFQRNYVWLKENVEQLLDDAITAGEAGDTHFFGPIVLLKDGNDLQVIDGQQRITTTVMALSILRDFLLDKKIMPESEASFVDNYVAAIRGYLYHHGISPEPKFQAGYLIRKTFNERVLPVPAAKAGQMTSNGAGLNQQEIAATKLLRAVYLTISKRLRKVLDIPNLGDRKHKVEQIYKGLTEKFQIHSMLVEDEFDAFRLFESINYLGIKLEPSDLLKSLTLRKIQKYDPLKVEDALTEWDTFIKNLAGYKVSGFLRHYLLTTEPLTIKVQASKIFGIFKDKLEVSENNPNVKVEKEGRVALEVVSDLVSASRNYAFLLSNPDSLQHSNDYINKAVIRMNYLGDTHRVLLLSILQSHHAESFQLQAFRAAEYLTFRNVSSRANRQDTENDYRKFGHEFKAIPKDDKAAIDLWCQKVTSQAVSDEFLKTLAINNTNRVGIQYDPREDLARYALGVLTDDIDDFIFTKPTLEHLAPQSPASTSNWKTQVAPNPDIYDVQIYWWGNLTWLEKSLNSGIQNNEWGKKKTGNPDNNVDGLKKSKFVLTEQVCKQSSWTSNEIISRGDWMLKTFLQLRSADWVISGTNGAKQVNLW